MNKIIKRAAWLLALAGCNEPEDVIGVTDFFSVPETCSQIKDCHLCALSSCTWESEQCSGVTAEVTFETFFENAPKCEDTLKICNTLTLEKEDCGILCQNESQKYNRIEQTYNFEEKRGIVGTRIPVGYFCMNTAEVNLEYSPVMFYNQSSNSEYMIFHEHYSKKTLQKGSNSRKDFYSGNQDIIKDSENNYGIYVGLEDL